MERRRDDVQPKKGDSFVILFFFMKINVQSKPKIDKIALLIYNHF